MKNNKHSFIEHSFILLTLLAATVACTSKELVEEQKSNGNGAVRRMTVAATAESGSDGGSTKVDTDAYTGNCTWSAGDEIAVHSTDGLYYVFGLTSGAGTASATFSGEFDGERNLYAVYPAAIVDHDNVGSPNLMINLPSTYDIDGSMGTSSPLPMIADNSGGGSLSFKHVGSVFRLTLKDVPVGTKTITVMTDQQMYGSFTVTSPASATPTIAATDLTGSSLTNNTLTFILSSATTAVQDIILNVPLPVGTFHTLTACAYDTSGTLLSKDYNDLPAGRVTERHGGRRIRLDMAAGTNLFNGYRISPGAMYYDGSTFQFSNTWEGPSSSYKSVYSLNEGSYYFNWYELSTAFNSTDITEQGSDTFDNRRSTAPCWSGTGWKIPYNEGTMSYAEIVGTSGSRAGSTVNGTANARFARIQLTGVQYFSNNTPWGLLLFPDGKTITGKSIDVATSGTSPTNTTGVTKAELDVYLSQGCVFLPASGSHYDNWGGGGNLGNYWSGTSHASDYRYSMVLFFGSSQFNSSAYYQKAIGYFAIRAVR